MECCFVPYDNIGLHYSSAIICSLIFDMHRCFGSIKGIKKNNHLQINLHGFRNKSQFTNLKQSKCH